MRINTFLSAFLWIVLVFLQIAAIRKNEDPILATQTSPIAYKDKMEEMKDGQKEAPKPSYEFYHREKFMAGSNLDKKEEPAGALKGDRIPSLGDPVPENVSGPSPAEEPSRLVPQESQESNESSETKPDAPSGDDGWSDEPAQNSLKN